MKLRLGKIIAIFGLVIICSSAVFAQPEISIGEISLSSLKWGPQTATFEVTNLTEYMKTISVLTKIDFEGTYLNPSRFTRLNYNFDPNGTMTIEQPVLIPGNYGKAKLTVAVYDVVDTLDPLLDYQRVFEQPYSLNYHIPDEILPYFQEEITLPPMVSTGLEFDNEFVRLFCMMVSEGKSYQEIAELCKCDLSFVQYTASVMTGSGFMKANATAPELTMSVITLPEAKAGRDLAEKVADELAVLVEKNIPAHRANLKTQAAAGIIPPNEDEFMHGGAALYYTYPTVTTLLFWFDMGQKFINPGGTLNIYQETDLCRSHIPDYMYAVQGGPYYNGTAFYNAELGLDMAQITFADSILKIECIENFESIPKLFPELHWKWTNSIAPEPFVLDTAVIRHGLKGIGSGTDAIVEQALADLKAISVTFGHKELLKGERYWFWNLVTSRATLKLIDKGVIIRRSGGFFSYEAVTNKSQSHKGHTH